MKNEKLYQNRIHGEELGYIVGFVSFWRNEEMNSV